MSNVDGVTPASEASQAGGERPDLSRVVVIGCSCSGKSTFSKALADRLGIDHVELDRFYWLPGWVERYHQQFLDLVAEQAATPRWVMDGNYRHARDLIWPRATAVVWLDYPLPLVIWRSLKRTITRSVSGEEICNGNRESWKKSFFSRDSILLWVLTSYGKVQARSEKLFAENAYPDAAKIRLRGPAETKAFLAMREPGIAPED